MLIKIHFIWFTKKNEKNILKYIKNETLHFAWNIIKKDIPEDGHKEFFASLIIILGSVPPQGIYFLAPDSYHLERWIANEIYCLKTVFVNENCVFAYNFIMKQHIRFNFFSSICIILNCLRNKNNLRQYIAFVIQCAR